MKHIPNESAGQRKKPADESKSAERINQLKEKVNVDEQAIREAREAVGDDEQKIKEYLINNRGL